MRFDCGRIIGHSSKKTSLATAKGVFLHINIFGKWGGVTV